MNRSQTHREGGASHRAWLDVGVVDAAPHGDRASARRVFEAYPRRRRWSPETLRGGVTTPGQKGCRIEHELMGGGHQDPEQWPQIISSTVDAMVRLEAAIRPHLNAIR